MDLRRRCTRGLNRTIRWGCGAALVLAAFGAAAGQVVPGAGSPTRTTYITRADGSTVAGELSHGWTLVGAGAVDPAKGSPTAGLPGVGLVHLPPRESGLRGPSPAGGARAGSIRIAARLYRRPARIAAWENRVFLAFEPETGAGSGDSRRQVLTLWAHPGPTPGFWVYEPSDRLATLPSLPGAGVLIGLVGSSVGPIALIQGMEGSTQTQSAWTLLRLDEADDRWVDLPLEPGAIPARARVALVSEADAISLVVVDGSTAKVLRLTMPEPDEGPAGVRRFVAGAESSWIASPLSLSGPDGVVGAIGSVVAVRGRLIAATQSEAGVSIWWLNGGRSPRLAEIGGVSGEFSFVPLDQCGRVAVLWNDPESSSTGSPLWIAEVSAFTGRVVYRGRVLGGGVVSGHDLRALAAVLLGITILSLVFVLRPDRPTGVVRLGRGVVPASGSQRVLAACIDLIPAMVVAAKWYDVGVFEMLGVFSPVGPGEVGVGPLALAALLAAIHTTISEWLGGRSMGKLLTGCRVVRLERCAAAPVTPASQDSSSGPADAQMSIGGGPRLWQAAARNAFRWALPPLALLGLVDRSGRHFGDLLARTMVVTGDCAQGSEASGEP